MEDFYREIQETQDIIKGKASEPAKPEGRIDPLRSGRMEAFSTAWFMIQHCIDRQKKGDVGYINWKAANLLIGFIVGLLVAILSFGSIVQ